MSLKKDLETIMNMEVGPITQKANIGANDQIAAALAWIAELDPTTGPWDAQMKALAADYERQREEIKKLQAEYSDLAKEAQARFVHLEDQEEEIERLKAQLASIKDHADEYLVNEDLTAEKAMRLIGRKLA